MLYREIIAVFSEIHTKHINTLCGQNAVTLFVYNRQYEQFKIRSFTWTAELDDTSSATYPKDQLLFLMHVHDRLITVCTFSLCFRRCFALLLSTPSPGPDQHFRCHSQTMRQTQVTGEPKRVS